MGAGRNGYDVLHVCRAAPLLLVFDGTGRPAAACDQADVWQRIARRRDRPCGLVLLRDGAGVGYYRGVAGLGGSIDETAGLLLAMLAGFSPTRVITCGAGLGGHASLVFGTLLGADRVVAVEPVAHLIADELALYNDRRWGRVLAELPEPSPARRFDVPGLMARLGFAGHALVLFGTGRGTGVPQAAHLNLIHAQWLARHERVTLCPFPAVRHDLWGELARRGELAGVLEHHLFELNDPPRGGHEAPGSAGPGRATARRCVVSLFREEPVDGPAGTEVEYAAAGGGDAPEIRKVDDGIRQWIAENLLIGAPPEDIARRMLTIGITERVSVPEIRRASESPYLRGALLLQNRLKERDGLLAVYRQLGRLRPGSEAVERRDRLTRTDLFEGYYTRNRPVVIVGMMADWPALGRWSLDELEHRLGDRRVRSRVRLNEKNLDEPFREGPTQVMTLSEYVGMIRRAGPGADFCLTTEDPDNRDALDGLWDDLGPVPEYLDGAGRPNGTLRIDPAGSTTPFRHELNNTLLALVLGKLRVRVVPSWDLPLMKNTWQVFSELDGRRTPAACPAEPDRPQVLECLLEPGEALFLPVGWWWFVETVEASASVTATNFVFDNDFPWAGKALDHA